MTSREGGGLSPGGDHTHKTPETARTPQKVTLIRTPPGEKANENPGGRKKTTWRQNTSDTRAGTEVPVPWRGPATLPGEGVLRRALAEALCPTGEGRRSVCDACGVMLAP